MTDERNRWLDIVKGLTIFLMILGHCIQNGNGVAYISSQAFWSDKVTIFIYSFHMPLFMLISGYFLHYSLKKRPLVKALRNKINYLLYPIIIFNLYNYIIGNTTYIDNLFYIIINLNDLAFKIFDGYWFLWAVLIFSILVTLVHFLLKDNLVIYIVIFFLLFFIPNFIFNLQTFRIDFMYPFFIIGYLFPKWEFKLTRPLLIWFLVCAIFAIQLYLFDEKDYIYASGLNILHSKLDLSVLEQIKIDLFRISIGISGSLFFLISVYYVYHQFFKLERLWKIFSYIGVNSLLIYCLQEILITFLIRSYAKDFELSYFNNLLQTFFTLFCCFIIIEILKRNELLRKLHLG